MKILQLDIHYTAKAMVSAKTWKHYIPKVNGSLQKQIKYQTARFRTVCIMRTIKSSKSSRGHGPDGCFTISNTATKVWNSISAAFRHSFSLSMYFLLSAPFVMIPLGGLISCANQSILMHSVSILK